MPAIAMLHENDPREALLEKIGDISDIHLLADDVMVAIYERPEKTRSGLYLAPQTRDEDDPQGKVGLVVKLGSIAFQDDSDTKWRDEDRCQVGDWVFFRPADGWRCTLNTLRQAGSANDSIVKLRIIRDKMVRGRVSHPDQIY